MNGCTAGAGGCAGAFTEASRVNVTVIAKANRACFMIHLLLELRLVDKTRDQNIVPLVGAENALASLLRVACALVGVPIGGASYAIPNCTALRKDGEDAIAAATVSTVAPGNAMALAIVNSNAFGSALLTSAGAPTAPAE